MTFSLIIVAVVLWYVLGVWSFIYWIRMDEDVTVDYLMLSLLGGLFGPLAWLIGWDIHRKINETEPIVVFKRRKS